MALGDGYDAAVRHGLSHDELRRLARDRRLLSPEIHPPNSFYGNARILRAYAGLPADHRVAAVIEHGIPQLPEVWSVDLDAHLPLFLCATMERAAQFERDTGDGRRAMAVGPMVHYAPSAGPESEGPRRLVGFPAHSSHYIHAEYDVAAFARMLAERRDDGLEVHACLYWRDILMGRDEPFRALDIPCVTAGHLYDQNFLVRLRSILEGADAVLTNEVGTHVWFAAHLGRPVEILNQDIVYSDGWDDPMEEVRSMFAEPRRELSAEQVAFVRREVGGDQVRTQTELRTALTEAARTYRTDTPTHVRARHFVRRAVFSPLHRRAGSAFAA